MLTPPNVLWALTLTLLAGVVGLLLSRWYEKRAQVYLNACELPLRPNLISFFTHSVRHQCQIQAATDLGTLHLVRSRTEASFTGMAQKGDRLPPGSELEVETTVDRAGLGVGGPCVSESSALPNPERD